MTELYRVCVIFIACQLYCSAQGSALPLGKVRQGKLNSGETEEQRDYQAEHESSQERQLQESEERRQLKKQQLYQSEAQQSRQQESDEQNDSQQEPSQELLEQREDSQERVQLNREHSQEEDQEEQEEPEEQEENKNQKPRQKLQQAKQQKEHIVEDNPTNSEETLQREKLREREDQHEVEYIHDPELGKTENTNNSNIEHEVFAKVEDFKYDMDNSTQIQDQESIGPSPGDATNKTETDGVIPDYYNQTQILGQQQISQDQLHNIQHVEEATQQRVDHDTQEKSTKPNILQELNQTVKEQQSETQPLQKPGTEQEENDLHGQPSKQQHQYLPQPLETKELQSRPDTQIETQIPPPRATDIQSGENSTERDTKGHESIVLDNYKQTQNKSDDTRSEEDERIQRAATDQQSFIEPNFMITPMIHPNITRPYAFRRVNLSRNVTGMESADESRTILKAALGLLTGLNMDTNNFGYNMPSTGKFTASNTMSFLGKIFNTDFSISYGSPAASTHTPSIYPHTQVVNSPPLPMGHHFPVSVPVVYNTPLAIGHSNYYDRQEPHIQDEYTSFPPYGNPHPDNVNWHRKPQFVTSNGPHPDHQHVGKLQEQHELQRQEQTQIHQHQEQYQLQQHILRDQIQPHQQPEQHQLQQQLQNQLQQPEQNQLQHHLQHQQEEQYRLEQLQEQDQQHLLPQQQQHYEVHQQPEFFTSDSTIEDYNRYETTVGDGDHTELTVQPEVTTTTETPFTSKSEERSDSDVKQDSNSQSHSQPEDQDSSKTDQDDDRSLPHDSREVSIDSDQYIDEGSFSEEEIVRKKEKKRKKNKGRRRHHHRHHSRSDRRSQDIDSNESNVGSEDTRYRSSEDSRERDDRTLGQSGESRL